jgi:hypothetical protein
VIPFQSNPQTVLRKDLNNLLNSFKAAPTGRFYSEEVRDFVMGALKSGHSEKSKKKGEMVMFPQDGCVTCYLAYALNQIDLDLVAPDISPQTISGGEKTSFNGTLWLKAENRELKDHVILEISGYAPTGVSGYRSGWPVAVYNLSAEENNVSNERFDIAVYYGGMHFQGIEQQLRLIQWTGDEYVDITTWTDTRGEVIHGSAVGLGSFAILEKHFPKKEIWYRQ